MTTAVEREREALIRSEFDRVIGSSQRVEVFQVPRTMRKTIRVNGKDVPYQRVNAWVRRGMLRLVEHRGSLVVYDRGEWVA